MIMANATVANNILSSKQFFSMQSENIILKEKVTHLTRLLEQHKSEFERMKAFFEVKCNQQEYKYTNSINQLQQQIKTQKDNLNTIKETLENMNRKAVSDRIEHENELKLLTAQIQFYTTHSYKVRQSNITQSHEINRLKNAMLQRDCDIFNLQRELQALTYSYDPLLPRSNRSSITRLVKLSPNITPKSEAIELSERSISEFNTTYVKQQNTPSTSDNKYRSTTKSLRIDVSLTKNECDESVPMIYLKSIKSSSSTSSPSLRNTETLLSLDTSVDVI